MRRVDAYSNLNRNNTVNGTHQKPRRINTVSPEILMGQIWLHDNETTGVEIIELDSNDSFNEDIVDITNNSHAWSYVNHDKFQIPETPAQREVNSKGVEKINSRSINDGHATNSHLALDADQKWCTNDFFSNNQFNNDRNLLNHQINCFTIVNNASDATSDCSENNDVEFIDPRDMTHEFYEWNSRSYDNEDLAYNTDLEVTDADKPTIWICSYKNNLFAQKDFPILSSHESSTVSIDICEDPFKANSNKMVRVPTPMPGMYVPKLNLSIPPALPTVTEVTEPKHSSNESFLNNNSIHRPTNNWFTNNPPMYGRLIDRERKSRTVLDWMCLSPREKRMQRRIPLSETPDRQEQLQTIIEANSIKEFSKDNEITHNCLFEEESAIEKLEKPSLKDLTHIIDTSPTENFKNNNWVAKEKLIDEDCVHEYDIEGIELAENGTDTEDVSKKSNNVPKSSRHPGTHYFSTTDRIPPLHLSLESELEEGQTCFRRVLRCFPCFK